MMGQNCKTSWLHDFSRDVILYSALANDSKQTWWLPFASTLYQSDNAASRHTFRSNVAAVDSKLTCRLSVASYPYYLSWIVWFMDSLPVRQALYVTVTVRIYYLYVHKTLRARLYSQSFRNSWISTIVLETLHVFSGRWEAIHVWIICLFIVHTITPSRGYEICSSCSVSRFHATSVVSSTYARRPT